MSDFAARLFNKIDKLEDELTLLRQERDTLRELVREALPRIQDNWPKTDAQWIERAEKALEAKQKAPKGLKGRASIVRPTSAFHRP
jgi:hypothetical protein